MLRDWDIRSKLLFLYCVWYFNLLLHYYLKNFFFFSSSSSSSFSFTSSLSLSSVTSSSTTCFDYHHHYHHCHHHHCCLQMLLTELYGLDTCFLHTLVNSGGGEGEDPQPLVLQPYLENQLLQFQTVREATTGCEVQVLQAGHPPGLMAYLFTLWVPLYVTQVSLHCHPGITIMVDWA